MLGVVVSRKADCGIIVTSGRFTQEAIRFAEQNPKVKLVAGPELAELIASVQNVPPVAAITAVATAPTPVTNAPRIHGDEPTCPSSGSNMVKRKARKGAQACSEFWGCPRYPAAVALVLSDDRPSDPALPLTKPSAPVLYNRTMRTTFDRSVNRTTAA